MTWKIVYPSVALFRDEATTLPFFTHKSEYVPQLTFASAKTFHSRMVEKHGNHNYKLARFPRAFFSGELPRIFCTSHFPREISRQWQRVPTCCAIPRFCAQHAFPFRNPSTPLHVSTVRNSFINNGAFFALPCHRSQRCCCFCFTCLTWIYQTTFLASPHIFSVITRELRGTFSPRMLKSVPSGSAFAASPVGLCSIYILPRYTAHSHK